MLIIYKVNILIKKTLKNNESLKNKKKRKRKVDKLKTMEDDFDIDIDNNSRDYRDFPDYIIDLDEHGRERDPLI